MQAVFAAIERRVRYSPVKIFEAERVTSSKESEAILWVRVARDD
jgi:hypothetical protein